MRKNNWLEVILSDEIIILDSKEFRSWNIGDISSNFRRETVTLQSASFTVTVCLSS